MGSSSHIKRLSRRIPEFEDRLVFLGVPIEEGAVPCNRSGNPAYDITTGQPYVKPDQHRFEKGDWNSRKLKREREYQKHFVMSHREADIDESKSQLVIENRIPLLKLRKFPSFSPVIDTVRDHKKQFEFDSDIQTRKIPFQSPFYPQKRLEIITSTRTPKEVGDLQYNTLNKLRQPQILGRSNRNYIPYYLTDISKSKPLHKRSKDEKKIFPTGQSNFQLYTEKKEATKHENVLELLPPSKMQAEFISSSTVILKWVLNELEKCNPKDIYFSVWLAECDTKHYVCIRDHLNENICYIDKLNANLNYSIKVTTHHIDGRVGQSSFVNLSKCVEEMPFPPMRPRVMREKDRAKVTWSISHLEKKPVYELSWLIEIKRMDTVGSWQTYNEVTTNFIKITHISPLDSFKLRIFTVSNNGYKSYPTEVVVPGHCLDHPSKPQYFQIVSEGKRKINLTWEEPRVPNSMVPLKYHLRAKFVGTEKWQYICDTEENHVGISNMMFNTKIEFKLTAANRMGESEPAHLFWAETELEPPSNVSITFESEDQIRIMWKAPTSHRFSPVPITYCIDAKDASGKDWVSIARHINTSYFTFSFSDKNIRHSYRVYATSYSGLSEPVFIQLATDSEDGTVAIAQKSSPGVHFKWSVVELDRAEETTTAKESDESDEIEGYRNMFKKFKIAPEDSYDATAGLPTREEVLKMKNDISNTCFMNNQGSPMLVKALLGEYDSKDVERCKTKETTLLRMIDLLDLNHIDDDTIFDVVAKAPVPTELRETISESLLNSSEVDVEDLKTLVSDTILSSESLDERFFTEKSVVQEFSKETMKGEKISSKENFPSLKRMLSKMSGRKSKVPLKDIVDIAPMNSELRETLLREILIANEVPEGFEEQLAESLCADDSREFDIPDDLMPEIRDYFIETGNLSFESKKKIISELAPGLPYKDEEDLNNIFRDLMRKNQLPTLLEQQMFRSNLKFLSSEIQKKIYRKLISDDKSVGVELKNNLLEAMLSEVTIESESRTPSSENLEEVLNQEIFSSKSVPQTVKKHALSTLIKESQPEKYQLVNLYNELQKSLDETDVKSQAPLFQLLKSKPGEFEKQKQILKAFKIAVEEFKSRGKLEDMLKLAESDPKAFERALLLTLIEEQGLPNKLCDPTMRCLFEEMQAEERRDAIKKHILESGMEVSGEDLDFLVDKLLIDSGLQQVPRLYLEETESGESAGSKASSSAQQSSAKTISTDIETYKYPTPERPDFVPSLSDALGPSDIAAEVHTPDHIKDLPIAEPVTDFSITPSPSLSLTAYELRDFSKPGAKQFKIQLRDAFATEWTKIGDTDEGEVILRNLKPDAEYLVRVINTVIKRDARRDSKRSKLQILKLDDNTVKVSWDPAKASFVETLKFCINDLSTTSKVPESLQVRMIKRHDKMVVAEAMITPTSGSIDSKLYLDPPEKVVIANNTPDMIEIEWDSPSLPKDIDVGFTESSIAVKVEAWSRKHQKWIAATSTGKNRAKIEKSDENIPVVFRLQSRRYMLHSNYIYLCDADKLPYTFSALEEHYFCSTLKDRAKVVIDRPTPVISINVIKSLKCMEKTKMQRSIMSALSISSAGGLAWSSHSSSAHHMQKTPKSIIFKDKIRRKSQLATAALRTKLLRAKSRRSTIARKRTLEKTDFPTSEKFEQAKRKKKPSISKQRHRRSKTSEQLVTAIRKSSEGPGQLLQAKAFLDDQYANQLSIYQEMDFATKMRKRSKSSVATTKKQTRVITIESQMEEEEDKLSVESKQEFSLDPDFFNATNRMLGEFLFDKPLCVSTQATPSDVVAITPEPTPLERTDVSPDITFHQTNMTDDIQGLINKMQFQYISDAKRYTHEKWKQKIQNTRIALSKQSSRFELPIDMKSLAGMSLQQYMTSYCRVSRRRENFYKKYFQNHDKDKDWKLNLKEMEKALREVFVDTISTETIADVKYLLNLEEDELITLKFFQTICALVERLMFSKFSLGEVSVDPSYNVKDKIEEADFEGLRFRLEAIEVPSKLRTLLFVILDPDEHMPLREYGSGENNMIATN